MKHLIQIQPLEPIVSRDARPFDATPGAIAFSMPDFSPSMVAGTVRTWIGKHAASQDTIASGEIWEQADSDAIKKSVIRGPLYMRGETLFYPFPQDMYVYEKTNEDHKQELRVAFCSPNRGLPGGFLGTGKNALYEDVLWPPTVPPHSKEISGVPAYISEELMTRWLATHPGPSECGEMAEWLGEWRNKQGKGDQDAPFLRPFDKDIRHHTEIETGRRVAAERRLFTTEAISMPRDLSILAEVDWRSEEWRWPAASSIHSMGGERRLAYFRRLEDKQLPGCPPVIAQALQGQKHIRMVLATPAYFSKGWKPGWLNEQLETTDSFGHPVKLRLRWANISGWRPYSGWSYKENSEKAIRRMVPAGSVYFFEVIEGQADELAIQTWLTSVSDDNRRKNAHDRDDGFGLALWGVWRP